MMHLYSIIISLINNEAKLNSHDPRNISLKTTKKEFYKIYLPISHNRYRNMNMTMACQFSSYRDCNSFRSHRRDLALLPVHPGKPQRGSVALIINNFDMMILKFVKGTREKDKENRQLKHILRIQ